MPSGLQTEWRNEIGLSSEFIQRSKDNTNDFIAVGFTFNHSSLHSVFATWLYMTVPFMKKNVVLPSNCFEYFILSRLFLSCANLITDNYIKYYGIIENHF